MVNFKNKKIIAVDLDGTLLDINGKVSINTCKYLKELKDKGYIIVIATGRILRNVISITNGALFANYIVSNDGGAVYDLENDSFLFKNVISKETADEICLLYNDDIHYVEICDLNNYYKFTTKDYVDTEFSKIIKDKEEFLNNTQIVHMAISLNNKILDMVSNFLIAKNFSDVKSYIMQDSFSDNRWIQISGKDVCKYNAIKIIADLEGVSNDNIIAFGDGRNDIEMIRKSGVGVAMGNALDCVKEVADYITKSHNEDGILLFLKGYLENDK